MLQNALHSLLGVTIIAVVLVGASGALVGRVRRTYQVGLTAAMIAYLIALPIAVILQWIALEGALDEAAGRLISPFVAPTIEETARIGFVPLALASLPKEGRTWPSGLAFGFGYGLLESVAKLSDFLLQSSSLAPDRLAASLSVPIVVLLLHICLSLIAVSLVARGWRIAIVFAITFSLHAAHNGSVLWLPLPTDIDTLLLTNFARAALFGVLISLCIASMRGRGKTAKRLAQASAE